MVVEREGNPRRKQGHVYPWLGKLAPFNTRPLDNWLTTLDDCLRPHCNINNNHDKVLVLGLAESSLIIAWYIASHLGVSTAFAVSTRDPLPTALSELTCCFKVSLPLLLLPVPKEVHSHAPDHQIIFPLGHHLQSRYRCVIIIEDEITTGILQYSLCLLFRSYTLSSHSFYGLLLLFFRCLRVK